MPLRVTNIENRVVLVFEGNLDVSVSRDLFRVCRRASPSLKSCVIDLSETAHVFDSGLALLQVLYQRLIDNGTEVAVLSDRAEISEKVATIVTRQSRGVRVGRNGRGGLAASGGVETPCL
jgi:ABC-type transporter Mla MlaB component